MKFVPTSAEKNLLNDHNKEIEQFARADRFLYEMSRLAGFFTRAAERVEWGTVVSWGGGGGGNQSRFLGARLSSPGLGLGWGWVRVSS